MIVGTLLEPELFAPEKGILGSSFEPQSANMSNSALWIRVNAVYWWERSSTGREKWTTGDQRLQ